MSLSHDARIKYEFYDGGNVYPGWRRYSFDAYGERTDGSNFTGDYSTNRGRVWPIFTGERGHYELEKIKADNGGTISPSDIQALKNTYVKGMEYFANQGLMISEQVWDSVGNNGPHNYHHGEGTNSATPLAWSHAEYVKLVRSLTDKNTWDSYSVVRDRYDSPDNVEFTCYNGYTNLGQNVYVGGSIPELGNWDTDKAIKLDPTEYPIWSKVISLPPNITFEWKCIIKSPVYWQPGPNNHHTTPESGLSYTQGSF